MAELAKEVVRVTIEDEMRQSFLDYAMSVIVSRALPDVRDGLKPVHRRVLYAMHELSNDANKPHKKSARIVGDVIGKYHPHGDTSVYDAIVRLAQPWSLRYMLVDGQGNFGSVDGDSPAAMRYTEIRLAKIAHELMADLDKETVDFQPNYDETEHEPIVLPSKVPNLLINGSTGIAVGMATNIPPHNLSEIIDACLLLLDAPGASVADLMQLVPGPDFPTAGIINGARGIQEAYLTGRGRVVVRAKTEIESERDGREAIIVTELPYQVNKAKLLEKIAELVKDKQIEGIGPDLRDESDKDGMRIYIPIKRGEMTEVVLNNLFERTALQSAFSINMVALVDGQPRTLNLKEVLECFLRHRREVVTRRTIFELRKAREKAHILEGLTVAIANIDPIIEAIKTAANPAEAKQRLVDGVWQAGPVSALLAVSGAELTRPEDLIDGLGLDGERYRLSDAQAQAILDLRLQKLTGLEQDKLGEEYREILANIQALLRILEDPERLQQVIREELSDIKERFGDARRTAIQHDADELDIEDLITPEDMVVTLSHQGYIKRQPLKDYQAQRRGGKGRSATAIKDEDFLERLWVANTHDTLLCFTSAGQVYWLKVYRLPQATRASRGRPIVNMLPLKDGEKVQAVLPVKQYDEEHFVFFATTDGTVKKTPLSEYSRPRSNGIIAINLDDGNSLIGAAITDGNRDIMLFASHGKAVRFDEAEVRSMGRTATGVRGMRLSDDQRVVEMLVVDGAGDVLTATERGFGKRTALDEYPKKGRGTMGVIAIQTSERNGALVGATQLDDSHELMLISNQGTLVRTRASEISVVGRNTQGVTLIRLPEDEALIGIAKVEAMGDEPTTDGEGGPIDESAAPAD
jgi:DNA gyrase subunit A